MKKLLKSQKGMTMLEVVIAFALFSIVSVPLIISFMNSLKVSHMAKDQLEINAVTRKVKEYVTEDLFGKGKPLFDFNSDGTPDQFNDFLYIDTVSGKIPATASASLYRVTPDIDVPDYPDYVFTVLYDSANYYNPSFDNVTNVLITIYDKNHKIVNKLKIVVPFEPYN